MEPKDTVFVSGASSGIGMAVARRFARDGARLVVSARREDRLRALAAELGGEVHVLPLDVRSREGVLAAVASLPEAFADVTVLVNSAGLAAGLGPAQEADLDDWDRMVDTNVRGLMYLTRALLPGMVRRQRGHVVNVGSVAGSYPYPGGNVYGGTKAFVAQLSLNLRADLLGTGVRVTSVEPGMVETEFSLVRFAGDADRAKKVYEGVHVLSPDDIAETIHWCTRQPAHVNVNRIEMMPVMQAFSPFAVKRGGLDEPCFGGAKIPYCAFDVVLYAGGSRANAACAQGERHERDGQVELRRTDARDEGHRGHRARARRRHRQPARQDGPHHAGPRVHEHRVLPERRHVHRR